MGTLAALNMHSILRGPWWLHCPTRVLISTFIYSKDISVYNNAVKVGKIRQAGTATSYAFENASREK